jgi:hypothetical protein
MKFAHTVTSLFVLAVFVSSLTPDARADEWNKKTTVRLSEPVEIPGQVLGAGTYVFKLLDSSSNRNIVQVFNRDENHLYATILAIPDYRLMPTGKTVITFEERAAGSPQAIRAWFYPGDNYGQEFVYPRTRAIELAKQTDQHVLSMPNEIAENTKKPATSASAASVVAMAKAPVKAIEHGGKETELAQVHQPTPPQAPPLKELPKTASLTPLLALIGMISLAAAVGVRMLSKRIL